VNKGFGVYGHAAEYITGGDILSGWINVHGYNFQDTYSDTTNEDWY